MHYILPIYGIHFICIQLYGKMIGGRSVAYRAFNLIKKDAHTSFLECPEKIIYILQIYEIGHAWIYSSKEGKPY